ncbi:MAG: acyl-CoA dehydrogenase family protein [Myxococcota bacterium]|nr:acyl-CoA dehydrogenase family protein [Myxococcota bacterium]
MDLDLNEEQQAVLDAVQGLLARHAGPARAIALDAKGEIDGGLDVALADAGFTGIALGAETGFLEAALVVEAVSAAAGVVSIAAQALVAPALAGRELPGPVAITSLRHRGPVRFAAHARTLLVDCGNEARLVSLEPGAAEPVPSSFMVPMGRFAIDGGIAIDAARGQSLGAGSGARLRDWWRLAIAAECAGAMGAALDLTVDYVKRRRQFGRAIGSFQAVQHRLSQCAVLREGTRWLAYEAAAHGAPSDAAATAAAYATAAANQIFAETHQLTGAMGFTREHDLHVWSMRLQALRLEAGGVGAHRRAAAGARWRPAPS